MLRYFDDLMETIGKRVGMVIPRSEALTYLNHSTIYELTDVNNMRLGALLSMFSAESPENIERAIEQTDVPVKRLALTYKASLEHGYPRSRAFENWLAEFRGVPA
jgi:hypothetical protein